MVVTSSTRPRTWEWRGWSGWEMATDPFDVPRLHQTMREIHQIMRKTPLATRHVRLSPSRLERRGPEILRVIAGPEQEARRSRPRSPGLAEHGTANQPVIGVPLRSQSLKSLGYGATIRSFSAPKSTITATSSSTPMTDPRPYLSWLTQSCSSNRSTGGKGAAGTLKGLPGRGRRTAALVGFIVTSMRPLGRWWRYSPQPITGDLRRCPPARPAHQPSADTFVDLSQVRVPSEDLFQVRVPREGVGHTRPWPTAASSHRYRSVAMIFSMFRSASAVMVTNGLTLVLPGISEPSMTYRPG